VGHTDTHKANLLRSKILKFHFEMCTKQIDLENDGNRKIKYHLRHTHTIEAPPWNRKRIFCSTDKKSNCTRMNTKSSEFFLKLFLLPRATHLAMDVFLIFLLKVSKSVKQWWVLTMNSTVFYLIFIAIKRGLCHVPTRSCTWSRDETNQSRYWEGTRLWWLWFRQLIVLSDRIFLSSSPDEQTHTN